VFLTSSLKSFSNASNSDTVNTSIGVGMTVICTVEPLFASLSADLESSLNIEFAPLLTPSSSLSVMRKGVSLHISEARSSRDGSGGEEPMDRGEGGVVHNDTLGEKGGSAAGMLIKGGEEEFTSTDKERSELLLPRCLELVGVSEAEPPMGERVDPVGGVAAGSVLLRRMPFSSPVLDLPEAEAEAEAEEEGSLSFLLGRGSRVLKEPMEFVELSDPDLSLRPADSLWVCEREGVGVMD
jgi:hypothetical protein